MSDETRIPGAALPESVSSDGDVSALRQDPVWPVAGLVALVSVAIAGWLLTVYLRNSGGPVIDADSLYEFLDWTRGEPLWRRLFHNGVGSWLQSLGLYLDIYAGPYGFWTRLIGYSLLAGTLAFLWYITRAFTARGISAAFVGVLLLFWFQTGNGAQSYWYLWRLMEASCQLMTAALFMFLILRTERLSPALTGALLVAAFIVSNVHIGYVMFFSGLFVLSVIESRTKWKLAFIGLLVLYTLYMFTLDGTFASLFGRFLGEQSSDPTDPLLLIQSVLGLSSQVIEVTFGPWLPDAAVLGLRVAFLFILALLFLLAVKRAFFDGDKAAFLFVYFAGAFVLTITLVTFGRLAQFGLEIMAVPRYFSYSLVLLMACIWYGLTLVRPWKSYLILVPVFLLGVFQTPHSLKTMKYVVDGAVFSRSLDYTLFLTEAFETPVMGLNVRRQRALRDINSVLLQEKAAGQGDMVLEIARRFRPSRLEELPVCKGGERRQPADAGTNRSRYEFAPDLSVHDRPDFGIVYAGEEAVAVGELTSDRLRPKIRLMIPEDRGELTLILGRADAEVRYICRKPV